jgi:hypothetical protein
LLSSTSLATAAGERFRQAAENGESGCRGIFRAKGVLNMFAAVILSGSLVAALPADSDDLTVPDVVKGLALDEAKFSYSDEPPGKLRGLGVPDDPPRHEGEGPRAD